MNYAVLSSPSSRTTLAFIASKVLRICPSLRGLCAGLVPNLQRLGQAVGLGKLILGALGVVYSTRVVEGIREFRERDQSSRGQNAGGLGNVCHAQNVQQCRALPMRSGRIVQDHF